MARLNIEQLLSDRLLFVPQADQPLLPSKKPDAAECSLTNGSTKKKRRSLSKERRRSSKMKADVPAALRRIQVDYGDESDEDVDETMVPNLHKPPDPPKPVEPPVAKAVMSPVKPMPSSSLAARSSVPSPSKPTSMIIGPTREDLFRAKRQEVLNKGRVRVFSEGAEEAMSFFGASKNLDYFNWDGLRDFLNMETFPGLPNEAANCYMLTGLQMLFAVPAFMHILNEHRDCACDNMCVIRELHRFVRMSGKEDYELRHVARLKRAVGFSHSHTEEDLHEFLLDLLSKVGTVFEPKPRVGVPKATPVEKVFGGCLRTQLKCLRCSHNAIRYENIMNLYLEVSSSVLLKECVRGFFDAERISDFRCERCGPSSSVEKSSRLMRSPCVLMVMLKRFTPCSQKINEPFHFTENLELGAFMMHGGGCASYTLLAVGEHLGGSIRHGHYAALVRGIRDPTKWYRKDDDIVSEERRGGSVGKNAYVLLYQRDDLCREELKDAARRPSQASSGFTPSSFASASQPSSAPAKPLNGIKPFQIKSQQQQQRPAFNFKPRVIEANNWKSNNGFVRKEHHHFYQHNNHKFNKFKHNAFNNYRYFRH